MCCMPVVANSGNTDCSELKTTVASECLSTTQRHVNLPYRRSVPLPGIGNCQAPKLQLNLHLSAMAEMLLVRISACTRAHACPML